MKTKIKGAHVENHGGITRIITSTASGAAELLGAIGAPLIGVITPKPDPKYGHTFKMPPLPGKKKR